MVFAIVSLVLFTFNIRDGTYEVVVSFCCYPSLHHLEFRLETLGSLSVYDNECAFHI